jgi:hypothetical protein
MPRGNAENLNTRGRKLGSLCARTPKPSEIATEVAISWAVGFLEGEGYFLWTGRTEKVSASQVNQEPLKRLQRLFGGNINGPYQISNPNASLYYRWDIHGPLARRALGLLYPEMSEIRKEQIDYAYRESDCFWYGDF